MSLAKALKTYVAGNTLLVSKLGGDPKKFRPYQHVAQDDFPYAEFAILDETVEPTSEGMTDVADALVQIDCYSTSYEACQIIRDAFFQELCRHQTLLSRDPFRGSIEGIHIVSCWRSGFGEGADIPQAGQSIAPYRLSQDFEIGYYMNTSNIT